MPQAMRAEEWKDVIPGDARCLNIRRRWPSVEQTPWDFFLDDFRWVRESTQSGSGGSGITIGPLNLYNAAISLHKPWRPKGFVLFETVIYVLVRSFRFIWISMSRVYGHYKYFLSYSAGTVFIRQNLTYTRRHILTHKDDPLTQTWQVL